VSSDAANAERQAWPWADSLDALVAAPEYHRLLFENERVRVLDVRIPAGRLVPVHTHRWPSVLSVMSPGQFIRRDGDGKLLLDTRQGPPQPASPASVWSAPMPPHSVENVGDTEIRLISVELKDVSI